MEKNNARLPLEKGQFQGNNLVAIPIANYTMRKSQFTIKSVLGHSRWDVRWVNHRSRPFDRPWTMLIFRRIVRHCGMADDAMRFYFLI